MTKREKSSTNK